MEEIVKKFLENVGVASDVITKLTEPEEGLEVDTLVDEFKANQREVYANDPDVIKNLRNEAKGKERGSVEREIRRVFNITPEEVGENELEGDYKKHLEFGKKKTEKQGNKTAQQIQTELQAANKENERLINEEIPIIKKDAQKEIDLFYIERYSQKLIKDERIGKILVLDDVATTVFEKGLKEKGYNVSLNDDRDDIKIRTKDGLIPQDLGKTRNLEKWEIAKDIFEDKKLVQQSNAGEEGSQPKPSVFNELKEIKKNENMSPGLEKAQKHLEKMSQNIVEADPSDVFRTK